jgi:hypothetical protein
VFEKMPFSPHPGSFQGRQLPSNDAVTYRPMDLAAAKRDISIRIGANRVYRHQK